MNLQEPPLDPLLYPQRRREENLNKSYGYSTEYLKLAIHKKHMLVSEVLTSLQLEMCVLYCNVYQCVPFSSSYELSVQIFVELHNDFC